MSMDFHPKEKKRAIRRAQKQKMLHKAEHVADVMFASVRDRQDQFEEWKKNWSKRHADNMKSCSCWMCCNPRKLGQPTIQEKRISQREKICD